MRNDTHIAAPFRVSFGLSTLLGVITLASLIVAVWQWNVARVSNTPTFAFTESYLTANMNLMYSCKYELSRRPPEFLIAARISEFDERVLLPLAGSGHIGHAIMDGTVLSESALQSLSSFSRLNSLTLNWSRISDNDLRYLTRLVNLKELELGNTCISEQGLAQLSALNQLRNLNIDNTCISANASLKGFTHLQEINASGTALCRFPFPEAVDVCEINLRNTMIDDRALAEISMLPHLRELRVSDTLISDRGIKQVLMSCKELHLIVLDNTAIGDSTVACMAKCNALGWVSIRGCSVTASAVQTLRNSRPGIEIVQ